MRKLLAMKLTYPLLRAALLALFIMVIGRPITGCSKDSGPNKTDTVPGRTVNPNYDSSKFLVYLTLTEYNTSGVVQDTFFDHETFVIYVVNGVVRFDSIMNHEPEVHPSSGTAGIYTAKWIPDGIGLINATAGSGFVEPGDTTVVIVLTSTGTVTPTWQISTGSSTSDEGGVAEPGWPPGFTFNLRGPVLQTPIDLYQPPVSLYYVQVLKDY